MVPPRASARPRSTATSRSAGAAVSSASTPSSCSTRTGSSTPTTTSTARRTWKGVHEQRAAALHQQHGLRARRQSGARRAARRGRDGARRVHSRPPGDDARARVRHAGADALHERRPALQAGGVGLGAVHRALPGRQRAAAGRSGAPSRTATTARWRSSRADRWFTGSRRTARPMPIATACLEPVLESGWTTTSSACGSAASGPTSATCCPSTRPRGHGEGFMHDTAMLLGALGWNRYDRGVEVITPFFRQFGHRADQRRVLGVADAADRVGHRRCPARWRRRRPALIRSGGPTMPHLVILYTRQLDAERPT